MPKDVFLRSVMRGVPQGLMLRPALFFKLVCDSVIFLYSALILTKKWFGSNSASEVYRTVVPELYGIQTAYF